MTNSTRIAARFTNQKTLTGYIQHKTGLGHNDFSQMEPIYLEPSNSIRWQKKVVILTNRRCYSATNDFVNAMRSIEDTEIIQLGDRTGGGSGLPFSSNCRTVGASASPPARISIRTNSRWKKVSHRMLLSICLRKTNLRTKIH